MGEREQFEKHEGVRCGPRLGDGYMVSHTQKRWETWQAARADLAAEKDAEIERLRGAAQKMFDALESLPDDALGTAPETHDCPAFSKKDQLLHEVAPVLREAEALAATATEADKEKVNAE